jgi:ankyrin repeat protein
MMKQLYFQLILIAPLAIVTGCASQNELQARRYMALIHACENDCLPKAVELLQEGVEPNGKDVLDEAPKSDVEYFAHLRDAPIVYAARNGNLELVRVLLEYGANPNWCCCSCVTALHKAILNKHIDVVALLLANGGDVTINYDGRISTLQLARQVGNIIIIQMIKEYGSGTAQPAGPRVVPPSGELSR